MSVLKKGMIWRPQYMKKTVQTLLPRTETTPKLQPWNASVLARRQIVHCHPQQYRFSVVCCRLRANHLPEVVGRTPNFEVCVVWPHLKAVKINESQYLLPLGKPLIYIHDLIIHHLFSPGICCWIYHLFEMNLAKSKSCRLQSTPQVLQSTPQVNHRKTFSLLVKDGIPDSHFHWICKPQKAKGWNLFPSIYPNNQGALFSCLKCIVSKDGFFLRVAPDLWNEQLKEIPSPTRQ